MNFIINELIIRNILNSCGEVVIEVELYVNNGFYGIGSAPAAIKAGKREMGRSKINTRAGFSKNDDLISLLKSRNFTNQEEFDLYVEELNEDNKFGADLTLSLSIAFCKACAAYKRKNLFQYISEISGTNINMPYPMINIFSGGIHSFVENSPFQQIMIIPVCDNIVANINVALNFYSAIEKKLISRGEAFSYSASSGMLLKNHSTDELLEIIYSTVKQFYLGDKVKLGIDVAAEHLKVSENKYKYENNILSREELFNKYKKLINEDRIFYIEDPFDSDDDSLWKKLTNEYGNKALIVGDDIFATNPKNIKKGLAGGILLKMNQVGSITKTIIAAKKAASLGMELCVSHRSCETEDTAMCALAVGLGANYIKIGGPRRGDRICKYNELLRISEKVENK